MPGPLDYLKDYLRQDRRVIPATASLRALKDALMAQPDKQALEIKMSRVPKPNIYPDPLPTNNDPTEALDMAKEYPLTPIERWMPTLTGKSPVRQW